MTDSEMKAVLSRSVIEETSTSVRLHRRQEYQSGILPKAGGEQYREIVACRRLQVWLKEVLWVRT